MIDTYKNAILKEMVEHVDAPDETYKQALNHAIIRHLFKSGISIEERQKLFDWIYSHTRGMSVLQPLMDNPQITEIMVNRYDEIYYEANGQLYPSEIKFENETVLEQFILNLFSRANRHINLTTPIADARLSDGTRANAVLPPIASEGACLTLRKFTGIRHEAEALIQSHFLTAPLMDFFNEAILAKKSIFICGGTGTGKTTLLNVLLDQIPSSERLVLIEDAAELQIPNRQNWVRLEARSSGQHEQVITLQDLLRTSLRMRPDRIIMGEVRGKEAKDLMHAMNTGHPGALCTGHGNACIDMFDRLCNLVLETSSLPINAIRQTMAACIDLIVHIQRNHCGHRFIDEVCAIHAPRNQPPKMQRLYQYDTLKDQLIQVENETCFDLI